MKLKSVTHKLNVRTYLSCDNPSRAGNSSASDLCCGPVPVCVLISVHLTELAVWRRSRLCRSFWRRALSDLSTWHAPSSGPVSCSVFSVLKLALPPLHPSLWWGPRLSWCRGWKRLPWVCDWLIVSVAVVFLNSQRLWLFLSTVHGCFPDVVWYVWIPLCRTWVMFILLPRWELGSNSVKFYNIVPFIMWP